MDLGTQPIQTQLPCGFLGFHATFDEKTYNIKDANEVYCIPHIESRECH